MRTQKYDMNVTGLIPVGQKFSAKKSNFLIDWVKEIILAKFPKFPSPECFKPFFDVKKKISSVKYFWKYIFVIDFVFSDLARLG